MVKTFIKVAPNAEDAICNDMEMNATEHHKWLEAIIQNNKSWAEDILQRCDQTTKTKLLNGIFKFPKRKSCSAGHGQMNFPHAWHMVLAMASKDVAILFLKHGVRADLTDNDGNNAIHVLTYVSFMRESIEVKMAQIFRILKDHIEPDIFKRMLLQGRSRTDTGICFNTSGWCLTSEILQDYRYKVKSR